MHISCKHNFLTDQPLLMKLYTVVVYNLSMYVKEDKTDNSSARLGNMAHSSSLGKLYNGAFDLHFYANSYNKILLMTNHIIPREAFNRIKLT